MVKEGTPGKYKLRALQEGSRQPLIEAYASRDEVDARKAALERAGYTVIVRLAETVREVLRLSSPTLPARKSVGLATALLTLIQS